MAETAGKLKFERNEAPTERGIQKLIDSVRETGMLVDARRYPLALCAESMQSLLWLKACALTRQHQFGVEVNKLAFPKTL